ncbi:MAG: sugar phosphate isomerase/epimerase family protein [Bacteroidota bacterium]
MKLQHPSGGNGHSRISRRKFFAAAAAVPLAAVAGNGIAQNIMSNGRQQMNTASVMNPTPYPVRGDKIALQLYTIREAIEQDLKGSLKKIADLGFTYVETAFWPAGLSHQTAAGYLKEFGLTPVACHIEISGDYQQGLLTARDAYGCTNMIWHGWPEDARYGSVGGTQELINLYNTIAAFCKANGMNFGLHNHWWEFMNKPGGAFVFEHWLSGLDPSVFFEVDTYWVKVAGHDPAAIIRRLGDRVKFLHLKDGPARWHPNLAADNPDPMTSVGKGNQDMPSILSAAAQHDPWLVLEMDKTEGDVFQKLSESLGYLSSH